MRLINRIFVPFAAVCFIASVASCGTKKSVAEAITQASTSTNSGQSADKQKKSDNTAMLQQQNFLRKVFDNAVYAQNIVSKIKFTLNTGNNDITVTGSLHMRKDEVIRIQITPLGIMEAGRLEFTKDYVLLVDRIHKEYVKASYADVDFLQRNGLDFYALQALFWNQLFVPGMQKMSDSSLKNFSANLSGASSADVTLSHGKMTYTWSADSKTSLIKSVAAKYAGGNGNDTSVNCAYSAFKGVGTKQFPTDIYLTMNTKAIRNASRMSLRLQLGTISTEGDWDSKSSVSSKYKQVSVQDILGKLGSL